MFVRVRPPLSYDGVSEKGGTLCVDVSSVNSVVLHSQPESKVFTFDQVAGPDITQVRVCVCLCACAYMHTYVRTCVCNT